MQSNNPASTKNENKKHDNSTLKNFDRRSLLRSGLFSVAIGLAWFAVSPVAQAVVPSPDGGYAGGNTAEGTDALLSLALGTWNTALGFQALNHDVFGFDNTATGTRALFSDTIGSNNTAAGVYALYGNTIGWYNNAVGAYALANNISGNHNTANGYAALYRNTGNDNTATGFATLYSNTTGNQNTAYGFQALYSNTTGLGNTANGDQALYSNTTGFDNTANGDAALYSNTTGNDNVATGLEALPFNTTGYRNTANGYQALFSNTTGGRNTAEGFQALYQNTGSNNVGLGFNAGYNLTTGSNNIHIGNFGDSADTNTIRIGRLGLQTRAFMQGIRGVTTANGNAIPVLIDSAGQLGTMSSSRRFKKQIKPIDQASEAILALKPVTFHYKSDDTGTPQFGLIAEEVAEVNPDLVVRDEKGEIYTVRYEAVNAMLLNEFLKAHRTVQGQQEEIDALKAELKEQKALIQKVSDKMELNKPAPQTAENR
jgi:hypothetical protein